MANPENLKSFKPGQSGNPAGRKPGKTLKGILSDLLDKNMNLHDPLLQKNRKMTGKEAVVMKLVSLAITQPTDQNTIRAIIEIFDRLEGKSIQKIDMDANVNTEGGRPSADDIFKKLEELDKRIKKSKNPPKK